MRHYGKKKPICGQVLGENDTVVGDGNSGFRYTDCPACHTALERQYSTSAAMHPGLRWYEIAAAAAIVVALLVYFPGSRQIFKLLWAIIQAG